MSHIKAATAPLPQTIATMQGFVDRGVVPGAILRWGGRDGAVRHAATGTLGFGKDRAVDERSIFRVLFADQADHWDRRDDAGRGRDDRA